MRIFPAIDELPSMLQTRGWQWEQFSCSPYPKHGFWLATDERGHQWLAKMRGSFYGYRELVFARIAQRLGWSCQSSAFAVLDKDALPLQQTPDAERTQLLSWFLAEHSSGTCASDCPLASLDRAFNAHDADPVEVLENSSLAHIMDWPRSEIAAPIFGANEPPGRLFTTDHELVIIDGEQMFSTQPSDARVTSWWRRTDGSPSTAGMRLTRNVCSAIGSLSDQNLLDCLAIPSGIKIRSRWSISKIVFQAKAYCERFLRHEATA